MTARGGGFSADGPAVQLSAANSIFPFQLAKFWQSRGLETILITHDRVPSGTVQDGMRLVWSGAYRSSWDRALTFYPAALILFAAEKLLSRPFLTRYSRTTGRPPREAREDRFLTRLVEAPPIARAARAMNPRFVFGHELTHYGRPTAMCGGIPRVLFPWGSDVFLYAETSPFMAAILGQALQSVDLVIPSSTTAAEFIRQRFGLRDEVVHPLSWGIDRSLFRRPSSSARLQILDQLGIPPASRIVINCRQFNPIWACFETLEAFIALARREPSTHFILLAGVGVAPHVEAASSRIEAVGLSRRFTVLEHRVSLERFAELVSVADVATSLMGIGDMRSASVLQAAAAGGVPVISDSAEHRQLVREGFRAFLVDVNDPEAVVESLAAALSPETAAEIRTQNSQFIARNEDQTIQFDKMLRLIDTVCDRYASAAGTRSP